MDRNGALAGAYDSTNQALSTTPVSATPALGSGSDENGVWNAVYSNGSLRVVVVG